MRKRVMAGVVGLVALTLVAAACGNSTPKTHVVIDAYSGVGTFALLMAPLVREAIGIEEARSAVRDAIYNARAVPTARFIQGIFARVDPVALPSRAERGQEQAERAPEVEDPRPGARRRRGLGQGPVEGELARRVLLAIVPVRALEVGPAEPRRGCRRAAHRPSRRATTSCSVR